MHGGYEAGRPTGSPPGGERERERLREWFSRVPGRLVLEAEVRRLEQVLPDLFGFYLLQVGSLLPPDTLAHSRVLYPLTVDRDGAPGGAGVSSIRGAADALPLASDSIDAVLLPHVLEFEPHPHETLREAQRVLVPEGHLVISGFNPWSLIGLARLLSRRRAGMPLEGHFLGLNRVRDWVALLGFDVLQVRPYFFRPPFRSDRVQARLELLESVGARVWPYFAGAYLAVARKKVVPLTPVRPRRLRQRTLVGVGLAEPTARAANG